nr:retrovirus-related Pol polyprotein from transposon TNT 1-94 [Tanacetum cinerariifolium]
GCIQTGGKIAELDVDEDVSLVDVDVEVEMDANDTDEAGHAKVKEVLEAVTAAKLMTEVVTTAAPITIVAQVPKASTPSRRRGVVIQDPKETTGASVIVHTDVKPKDKGKGILIEEPKPLKGKKATLQHVVALSTTEAEYMAFTEDVKETIWLKGLLIELGVNLRSVVVNCDNQSAIHLSRNAMFHERTKHINVRYHFIREIVESKKIKVKKIGTKDNAADAFTKVSLEYIIWSGVTASVKKRFLVVVVLGGLFEIRDHIVDAVVSARILEVSLVFPVLNGGKRKVLHVVDVARTSTELELALAAADATLQTIAHLCVSSELQKALLRLRCCGICNHCCLGMTQQLKNLIAQRHVVLVSISGSNYEKLELARNKVGKLYGEEKITEDPLASSDGNLIDKENMSLVSNLRLGQTSLQMSFAFISLQLRKLAVYTRVIFAYFNVAGGQVL